MQSQVAAVPPDVIHELAQKADAPEEMVADLYREELSRLERQARVSLYLPIVAARHVLDRLRDTHARG
jgi:hypothetical protein